MSDLGPSDTKPVLTELVELGLDDGIYMNCIHHAGHRISAMLDYDVRVRRYQSDGRNVLLHQKLVWILRTYKHEWKLPPGRKDVLRALAEASKLGLG
jgi:hypothetical protein